MNPDENLNNLATKRLNGEISGEQFRLKLLTASDVKLLKRIAEEFTPHPEVSVPVYQRALELDSRDPDTVVDLGFVHWLCGEDTEARIRLSQAYRLDPGHLKSLLLDAALESDPSRIRKLYASVLETWY